MSPTSRHALAILLTLFSVACDNGKATDEDLNVAPTDPPRNESDPTTGGNIDSGDPVQNADVDAVQAACTTGEDGTPVRLEAVRLQSTVTWALDFDDDAEAAGFVDCTYTRTFSGLQRLDIPHVCPTCDFIVEGDAVMTEGFSDCYEPIFGGTETRIETWAMEGLDVHRRSGSQTVMPEDPLTTLASPSGDGSAVPLAWDSEYTVNDDAGEPAGVMGLSATGVVSWAVDPTTELEEPFGPRSAPYRCGWECNDPGDLGGAYPLAPGEVLPNFRLDDQCGEAVDIYDFYGSYIVLDSAQSDCGPCLAMAEEAAAFRDTMTADGIPVRLIPLLGNGLSDVTGTPSDAVVDAWLDRFRPHDPVLADKGWGYAALSRYLPEHAGTDIAWPAWIVIGPDMTVIDGAVGFGSWDTIEGIIRTDWVARGETGPL
ncbi:MAG TPA: hypothetical protein DFR83_04370 [Deltaproteobacteria bacterium]|nr:hypothetical protein [Deltaproteobacteria bacterium]